MNLRALTKRLLPTLVARTLRKIYFFLNVQMTRKMNVGKSSYVDKTVHVIGWRSVTIGSNSVISENCWLNVNRQSNGAPVIRIGNNCFVGKRNFFTSGTEISMGDYCLTAIDCKFLGSSHVTTNPMLPYISAGTRNVGRIEIGSNCIFYAGSMVLGDVSIGHGCVIAAGSVIRNDVPPFSLVRGDPAVVIKRYHFGRQQWVLEGPETCEVESLMPTAGDYLHTLRATAGDVAIPMHAAAKSRGDLP